MSIWRPLGVLDWVNCDKFNSDLLILSWPMPRWCVFDLVERKQRSVELGNCWEMRSWSLEHLIQVGSGRTKKWTISFHFPRYQGFRLHVVNLARGFIINYSSVFLVYRNSVLLDPWFPWVPWVHGPMFFSEKVGGPMVWWTHGPKTLWRTLHWTCTLDAHCAFVQQNLSTL